MNDSWEVLRQFTQARIAQGRSGVGIRTEALLDFQLSHAMARDAVHQAWDLNYCAESIQALGVETLTLATEVSDRIQYLKRPDLGRKLDQDSRELLTNFQAPAIDIVLIMSNGLSSIAVEKHGLSLLEAILTCYQNSPLKIGVMGRKDNSQIGIGPICLVPNARVALSDEIGALVNAQLVVMIVGERPGLGAADSLGIYMTYHPNLNNTDAQRNCISNIRAPAGLSYQSAALKLRYLTEKAWLYKYSGVQLKDDMPTDYPSAIEYERQPVLPAPAE